MKNNNEIKCETNNDVTTLVSYIEPFDLWEDLYKTIIYIELDCAYAFGEECLKKDWLETPDGRHLNRAVYIDLSKKHPLLKWYYRFKLQSILRKYGVKYR